MADKKEDKPGKKDSPFADSGEVFESLFREELDALSTDRKEKNTPPKETKTTAVKRPKPPSPVKAHPPRRVPPKTETSHAVKKRPVSQAKVEASRKVALKIDAPTQRRPAKRRDPHVKGGKSEEVRHRKITNMNKIISGKIGTEPKLGGGSDRLKIALLCVVLVIAVGFIINSLGIVDFGRLLGLSEPTQKEGTKTRVAKEPPAEKTATVVAQPPQETTTPSAPEKTTSQMRRRIVQKPPETTTPYANPGVVQTPPKPAVSSQPRHATRQTKIAPPSTQKPVVRQTSPVPAPPAQKPVVAQKPTEPTPSTQKPALAQEPATTPTSTQTPVVAEAPAQPVPSTREPVIARTSPTLAPPTPKSETLGREELLPEEKVAPRPYSVYLGSYQTLDRAEKAISEHRTKGVSAYWVKVNLREMGVWYRVFTGYFKDHAEAVAFITKKRLAEGEVKRTRYATLIGVYATEGALQREFLTLSKLGYSPYVIERNTGESRLYVGAFYTQAGAKKLHMELTSKGVESRVVER